MKSCYYLVKQNSFKFSMLFSVRVLPFQSCLLITFSQQTQITNTEARRERLTIQSRHF